MTSKKTKPKKPAKSSDVPFDCDETPATKRAKKRKDKEDIIAKPLSEVISALNIKEWDLLIVGDGSGSTWDKPCGWTSVAVERTNFQRQVFYGAMSNGTSSISELMAYLQPLLWYADITKKRRKAQNLRPSVKNVHILTDNTYCQKSGSKNELKAKQGSALSVMINSISAQGFNVNWHWVGRESIGLNIYADRLSRASRLLIQNSSIREDVQNAAPLKRPVNDCNPLTE